ncbi:aminotransferase class I/II-fold pyridoxal phosphate-dependent enzyme [Leptolyngbya sp. FACHB-261]|uniref:aminotransferase class I/II-fold pyridoxal phosphate-dependent enzyme n=1 Tax=Leptolyngbya sp. FACHB-261 TaxID=2692806 RepID=UPI00168A260E|nr:aminotransferase class I/II-fold pyridoxal phosphate-dependent enzyme [Leptolyngbya sp. FACHB-261]MBD2101711.1 aminotransferase class I/II-fold pyridoxal phosphate-dependent enzyme [Leptolyngbya sp. FACHB-261]
MTPQAQAPILEALLACRARGVAPFYAPGHKGSPLRDLEGKLPLEAAVFELDLPELPEFDSLHDPQGPIQAAQQLAAELYGAAQTWFLVNGSTCGVQAMILAVCKPGDTILVPRNAHRSVAAGLILADAVPVYLEPQVWQTQGLVLGVSAQSVAEALATHPQARGVLLVSPSYDGISCDLAQIAEVVHDHGLPLLVDEAHGAHFGFHPDLPPLALASGADLVVQSTHKTLSALSQASMLHLGQGGRVQPGRVAQALRLLQTTSPSSVLLASLDLARRQLALQGKQLMQETLNLAAQARSWKLDRLQILAPQHLPAGYQLDPTRLCVLLSDLALTGFDADDWLREQFGVVAELPSLRQLVFILSLGNTQTHLERLKAGLVALEEFPKSQIQNAPLPAPPTSPPLRLSPRQAYFAPAVAVPLETAIGAISAELLCPYPPGIPIVMPGEEITAEIVDYLHLLKMSPGCTISGAADPQLRTIRVVQLS